MYKIIKIGNQEVPMLANGMLRMYYRNKFNRKIFTDLMASKKLLPLLDKTKETEKEQWVELISDEDLGTLEDLSDNCLKMAYTMAYCQDKNILPFEEWVESLGEFKIFDNWLSEVLELVMSTFC